MGRFYEFFLIFLLITREMYYFFSKLAKIGFASFQIYTVYFLKNLINNVKALFFLTRFLAKMRIVWDNFVKFGQKTEI